MKMLVDVGFALYGMVTGIVIGWIWASASKGKVKEEPKAKGRKKRRS